MWKHRADCQSSGKTSRDKWDLWLLSVSENQLEGCKEWWHAGTGGLSQDNKACFIKLQNHGKRKLQGEISLVFFFFFNLGKRIKLICEIGSKLSYKWWNRHIFPLDLSPQLPSPPNPGLLSLIPTRQRMEWCHQPGSAGSLTRRDFCVFSFTGFIWIGHRFKRHCATVVAQCAYIKLIWSDVQGDCYKPPAWCIWPHRSRGTLGDQRCPSPSLAHLNNSKHMHSWDEHGDSPVNGIRGMLAYLACCFFLLDVLFTTPNSFSSLVFPSSSEQEVIKCSLFKPLKNK